MGARQGVPPFGLPVNAPETLWTIPDPPILRRDVLPEPSARRLPRNRAADSRGELRAGLLPRGMSEPSLYPPFTPPPRRISRLALSGDRYEE